MNNTLSKIIIFASGGAVGAAVCRKYFRNKYERIANEEIESVKETFLWRNTKEPIGAVHSVEESNTGIEYHAKLNDLGKEIMERNEERKADRVAAKDICTKAGYADYEDEGDDEMDEPYVIPPEELGESGYEVESLTYYADGVLENDLGKVFDDADIEGTVGIESLTHFGEYEDDSVFVRNDKLKTDYEILADVRRYADIE